MLRFKNIIFYYYSSEIKLLLQKNAKFSSAGGSAPRPPCLRRLRSQTKKLALHCKFLATRLIPFLKTFFFCLHLNSRKKSVPFLVKTFFFALHLICSPERNGGRGSSPPMLKIGQNRGKIANYPPQCSTKIAPLCSSTTELRHYPLQ